MLLLDPPIVLRNICQNLILVILPLVEQLESCPVNEGQEDRGEEGNRILEKLVAVHSECNDEDIGDEEIDVVLSDLLAAEEELSGVSDVVEVPFEHSGGSEEGDYDPGCDHCDDGELPEGDGDLGVVAHSWGGASHPEGRGQHQEDYLHCEDEEHKLGSPEGHSPPSSISAASLYSSGAAGYSRVSCQ